ncbi:MAG: sigma-70 family RNA polymerase sigma factor, partial [Pseudomonadota bacterium]|nr:sigma-70 family RNA polymerase sigma factor [Pseudomonadota bacterium]
MRGLSQYTHHQDHDAEALVTRHAPLVKRIAYHLLARLPDSVQADDLIQAGMLGLLEATRRYDPAQGASFTTFAERRIRGAMLDEIRKGDWVPRSVHRKAREVAAAIRVAETAAGGEARSQDIARVLGIS